MNLSQPLLKTCKSEPRSQETYGETILYYNQTFYRFPIILHIDRRDFALHREVVQIVRWRPTYFYRHVRNTVDILWRRILDYENVRIVL